MTKVTLKRLPDGGFELANWPRWGAEILEHLPVLADPDPVAPSVQARLYPSPTKDDVRNAEWARHVRPELFALVASARDIVLVDLSTADRNLRGGIKRLVIPPTHVRGWISALNVARLHLAALHDVDAGAMRAPFDELTPKLRGPVELIDFYGWMQGWLVDAVTPPDDSPESPPSAPTAVPPTVPPGVPPGNDSPPPASPS